jgi:hypothetical protein
LPQHRGRHRAILRLATPIIDAPIISVSTSMSIM